MVSPKAVSCHIQGLDIHKPAVPSVTHTKVYLKGAHSILPRVWLFSFIDRYEIMAKDQYSHYRPLSCQLTIIWSWCNKKLDMDGSDLISQFFVNHFHDAGGKEKSGKTQMLGMLEEQDFRETFCGGVNQKQSGATKSNSFTTQGSFKGWMPKIYHNIGNQEEIGDGG